MNVGSLFSGIGGLDLGLERAGMRVVWQCEVDPFCSRVLARHWPDVPNLGDVTAVDWGAVEPVDLVCGGFPCQPVSVAGRRRAQADERWLWPEVARCLRHLRPRLALLENVPGLLAGPGMGEVLGDLAALGYDAEWESIPAAAVGAPHLRYRVFIVAHAVGGELRQQPEPEPWSRGPTVAPGDGDTGPVAYANGQRLEERRLSAEGRAHLPDPAGRGRVSAGAHTNGQGLAVGTCFGGDARAQRPTVERSDWWDVEPPLGRVAPRLPDDVARLRALGNAVVPQVAEWIGRRIMSAEASDGITATGGPG